MDNHVHILIQEVDDEIATSIKRICSSYVLWYNKKYERCGHLARELFINHHNEVNEDKYLDYEDFIRLTDDEARSEIIKRGITNLNALQHLEKSNRDYVLRRLKDINGVSIR